MTILDPASIRRLADMHAVYRMSDQVGRLLYIGITGRVGRFDDHAVKRWFPLVSVITLQWYATHAEAALAERRAIAAEKPRYNIAGSPIAKKAPRHKPVKPEPEPPNIGILSDILEVFGDDKGLYWQIVADRLAARFPRWSGAARTAIRAQCRSFGIPSADVRMGDKVLKGCRRADIERAVAQRFLKQAV